MATTSTQQTWFLRQNVSAKNNTEHTALHCRQEILYWQYETSPSGKKRTCWTIQCVTFLLVVCYMFISLISPHQPLHAHGRGQESREQLPLWLDVIAYSVGVVRTHRAILWITCCWTPYLSLAKRAQRVYLEPFIYAFHVEDMCTGKFTQIFIVWELWQADAANLQIPNN